MVSKLSQKIDELDVAIKKHNSNLARLEDDYNFQRRQFEEEYFRLEDTNRALNRYYEEKYEEVLAYLRQVEGDTSDELMALNRLIEDYRDATELSYRKERHCLDDKEDRLRQDYQRKRDAVEREIASCMAQKRQILE
ncbi:hypothetical protein SMU26_02975 [Streptococcus mutans 3SN1]|uniref:hypothetical protein n=1 Tax=Streptococcus mutans TaxID=1309 RepID=UPI0002B5CD3A|nr:hypothetical protein [Streptococcus mutans]EMB67274.1 hypothetical protein SMU26_02975 [Streptococcus mutans 3SN1]